MRRLLHLALLLSLGFTFRALSLSQSAKQYNKDEAAKLLLRAKESAIKLTEEGQRESLLGEIAYAQGQAGDFDAAKETIALLGEWMRTNALKNLSVAQASHGNLAGARESLAAAEKSSDASWEAALIASGQANSADLAGAIESAERIPGDYERALAFAWVAERFGKGRNSSETAELLAKSLTIADKLPSGTKKADVLWHIAEAQLELLDKQGACRTLLGAFSEAAGKDDGQMFQYGRVERLTMIAEIQVKAGDPIGARVSLRKATDFAQAKIRSRTPPGSLGLVAGAQVRVGDNSGAFETAQLALPGEARSHVLMYIAIEQSHKKDFSGALGSVSLIECPTAKAWALAELGAAQADEGMLDDSIASFAEARKSAEAVSVSRCMERIGEVIVVYQAQSGQYASAIEMARKSLSEFSMARSLMHVLIHQVADGELEGAILLADKEASPLVKGYMLLGIAQGLMLRPASPNMPKGAKSHWMQFTPDLSCESR